MRGSTAEDGGDRRIAMRLICASICLILVVAAAMARAEKPDAKAEVQAIYDHIGRAFEKKDIDGVTKFSLPDATVKYADGKELTLQEWKERARRGWTDIKQTTSRFKVEDATPDGDAAVATYAEAHDMLVFDPKDGKEHKINYQGKWRVTLKQTAEGWRLSRSVELQRRVTRDGLLIDQWPKGESQP
jgi:ketosteroid isomerase-like protein